MEWETEERRKHKKQAPTHDKDKEEKQELDQEDKLGLFTKLLISLPASVG